MARVSNWVRIGAVIAMIASPLAVSAQSDGQGVPEPELTPPSEENAPPQEPPPPDSPRVDAAPPAETPPAQPQSQRPPAPDIAVTDSQLLAILTDPAGPDAVTPTTSIPYVVGRSCYNWTIKYAPVEGELLLSEELILPGPARNWGTEGSRSEVNPQGSRAVTERRFDASTGTATAGWCVAKDDPVGSYHYIIRQGDREIARFDFTVGDLL